MLVSEISSWGAACTIFRRKCLVGLWLLALPLAALVFVGCGKDTTHTSSPYDMNCPVGFGANVTGGGGQNVVTVETQEALREVLAGAEPAIVYVKGTINLDSTISVGSNKSILGLSGAVISNRHRDTTAGVFLLMGSDNIIIRNLTILGPGAYDIDANSNDNISLIGATNVWVDHCDIQDGIDGNMDITNGSDNVCVSWTRFRYLIEPSAHGSGGNDDHRNSNLIGGSNNTADLDGGTRWNRINKEERKLYQLNAYRVLLTRARQGMVICVPEGNPFDPTRLPEIYDSTYNYLLQMGFEEVI